MFRAPKIENPGIAGRQYPEEQGLKRLWSGLLLHPRAEPVGSIQKNKDWNKPSKTLWAPCKRPVGSIQKNKDWNTQGNIYIDLPMLPVGSIQKNKDWNLTLPTGRMTMTCR